METQSFKWNVLWHGDDWPEYNKFILLITKHSHLPIIAKFTLVDNEKTFLDCNRNVLYLKRDVVAWAYIPELLINEKLFKDELLEWHDSDQERPNTNCEIFGRKKQKAQADGNLNKYKLIWDRSFKTTFTNGKFEQECQQWAYIPLRYKNVIS